MILPFITEILKGEMGETSFSHQFVNPRALCKLCVVFARKWSEGVFKNKNYQARYQNIR